MIILSCNDENGDFIIKKELELLDTLDLRLRVVNKKLDIDFKEINERIEEMDMDIMKMRMIEKEVPLKMSHNMERYLAIQKAYKNFYNPYKIAHTESEDLTVQLLTFRQSVIKQEYSKDKFKEFYAREEADLSKLEGFIKKHVQPVLNMEMEYRRIQSKIDRFLYGDELDAMKKK